jgi:hypothetical protein
MDLSSFVTPWPGAVRAYSEPGLATCLEQKRLYKDGLALPASRLEVEALSLAEWAAARGKALVLCPPDPLAPLTELIASAVHVADMARHYIETGVALRSGKRVAVVTTNYASRGLYRGLGVKAARSHSVTLLRDVVPAATLGRDGTVSLLGRDEGRGWSTVFVSSVAEVRSVGAVDLIVVELPAAGADRVLDLGIPVVIVARDPADGLLSRLSQRALVIAWGKADLARLREDENVPPRLACRVQGGTFQVVAVPAHVVCENAALFWHDLGPLLRAGDTSFVARELVKEAFTLFHDLLGLAVPVSAYESLTAPIRVRLGAIGAAARLTHGETRDLYLPMVEAELRDLAGALGASPPKAAALIETLRAELDEHRDVMVVARTAELARLYVSELGRDRALRTVRVTTLATLAKEAPADVAVLTGMAPTWARWVYRSGIARSMRVLAYGPEGDIESVQGFSEAALVRRAVDDQAAREEWFARPAVRDRVWSELSGDPRLLADGSGGLPPTADVGGGGVSVILSSPAEVPPGLWDGNGWSTPLEVAGGAPQRPDLGQIGVMTHAIVAAAKVTFVGGRWALMELEATVTRYRPVSGVAEAGFPVRRLQPDDKVLFLDKDSQKDLLDKILEVAGEVPALAVAATWVGHWRKVLAAGYQRFGTYDRFATALRSEGCTRQTQTIRLWVIGDTLRPDDREDVRRVGVVMQDDVLLHHHRDIDHSMGDLNGAHIKLRRRLSDMSMQVGSATAAGRIAEDEVVDERSGLTAADFRDSVDILTVQSIEPAGDVPYLVVGRLNDSNEGEGDA